MAGSKRQRKASRNNGRKSQGPRTEEGKKISRNNARTHGFSARAPVLPGEDEEAYRAFVQKVEAVYTPRDVFEADLVSEIALFMWLLKRMGDGLRTGLSEDAISAFDDEADPRRRDLLRGRTVLESPLMDKYLRQRTSLQNLLEKTLRMLELHRQRPQLAVEIHSDGEVL